YLGPVRRAGQGVLLYGTPDGEDAVVTRAGFGPMEVVWVEGRDAVVRTIDDLVAGEYSNSGSAPHLFGDRLAGFDADLRALLAAPERDRPRRGQGDVLLRLRLHRPVRCNTCDAGHKGRGGRGVPWHGTGGGG